MKFCKVGLFFALFGAICFSASAQTTKMRVDIPFNFMVSGKALPAGQYVVEPAFRSDGTAWRIYNDHDFATVLTHAETSPVNEHRRSLVFLRTTEGYALVQFWPTAKLGRDLTAPKVEHTLMADRDKYVEVASK
jgi:hypothetical protein